MQTLFGLYGAGGFGRECMAFSRVIAAANWGESVRAVFVEERPHSPDIDGVPVWSHQRFMQHTSVRYFNIAIADSHARERLAAELEANGAVPHPLVSPMAISYADADVGRGLVQCPFSTLSSRSRVGRYVHLNFGCYVAHDCVIGDFVTFAPAVQCLGRVHVGAHAFIGAGAVIRQGTHEQPRKIGAGATIGMGAVVLNDVAPGTTVVGNPARVLR